MSQTIKLYLNESICSEMVSDDEIEEDSDEEVDFDPDEIVNILKSVIDIDSLPGLLSEANIPTTSKDESVGVNSPDPNDIDDIMANMDAELAGTKIEVLRLSNLASESSFSRK